ncbi:hypothetical protein TorRG33x02_294610 [Trema orientale]|uniref:Uncharacterized protein n=1 Tax=Trema orientale TaxID=63057 RepID=A0A2P5C7M8_TREOI|nr:hypothetical protein TorRG33x02_294610 [Trema orientale]
MDCRRAPPNSSALFLISFDAINFLIPFATVSAFTTSSRWVQSLTEAPTPSNFVTSIAFLGWSVCIGHAPIGTPIVMLSTHEFHPQWLKNPPVDGCPKISNWGAHSLTTIPILSTLFSYPFGSSNFLTCSPSKTSPLSASLSTQMNFISLCSNPKASCSTSSSVNVVVVPNDT